MSKTNLNIDNYNAVVAAIQANDMVVGDDHNSGTGVYKAAGIAALVNGDKITPVLLIDSIAHCLNLTYLDENGKPRVSRTSVAGNVEGFRNDFDLTKAVAAYNKQQEGNEWTLGTLEHVVIFKNELTRR